MNELHLFAGGYLTKANKCNVVTSMTVKKCSKCKVDKDVSDFYPNKSQSSGMSSQCKQCSKELQRAMYRDNPSKAVERSRIYAERYAESYKKKRKENRVAIYVTESARKYGMTKDEVRELIGGGCCVICKKSVSLSNTNASKKPNIDHCHRTGRVRGLLCGSCNNLLGRCRDDVNILKSAIAYLNEKR